MDNNHLGPCLRIFSFRGEISGPLYLFWGLLLFAIKYPLDHLVATEYFAVNWSPFVYVSLVQNPLFSAKGAADVNRIHLWFGMLGVALPFLYVGLALTVQRLRALKVPLFIAGLFFVPFLNLVFFAFLVAMRPPSEDRVKAEFSPGPLDRFIPQTKLGCVFLAIILSVAGATLLFGLLTGIDRQFGVSVFVGIPYVIGYATVVLIGYRFEITRFEAISYACLSVMVCMAGFLTLAIEGIICVFMASPIVLILAAFGGLVAYYTRSIIPLEGPGKVSCTLLLPLLMVADYSFLYPNSVVYPITSHETIQASTMQVWDNVVTFPRIPKEMNQHWFLKLLRVPRLDQAVIDGKPPEAIRRCVFEGHEFTEPIEIFEPGRNLTFGVTGQPGKIDKYIEVKKGRFLLTAGPNGTTQVEGTTWIRLTLFPEVFWRTWVDQIVHLIHLRAFAHIKNLSEANARMVNRPSTTPGSPGESEGS